MSSVELKQFIAMVRDHSVSMSPLTRKAMSDYNTQVDTIKASSKDNNIETRLSVVNCGIAAKTGKYYDPYARSNAIVEVDMHDIDINKVATMTHYPATGPNTPLLDSVGKAIELMENIWMYNKDTPVLIMVITDGEENSSKIWTRSSLSAKMRELQATDMWTFAFRCPLGYSRNLINLGVPEGNILEWEQTEKGLEKATVIASQSFTNYYATRAAGGTSTAKFFVDTSKLNNKVISSNLKNIAGAVSYHRVDAKMQVSQYVNDNFGYYQIGDWYYELTKPETLQASKRIIIRDDKTGKSYTGDNARTMLGLPLSGECKIYPTKIAHYRVFVQSLSTNRNLMPNTEIARYKVA